jgi:hypothetical protein
MHHGALRDQGDNHLDTHRPDGAVSPFARQKNGRHSSRGGRRLRGKSNTDVVTMKVAHAFRNMTDTLADVA